MSKLTDKLKLVKKNVLDSFRAFTAPFEMSQKLPEIVLSA